MSATLALCASTLVLGFAGSVHCFGMCGGIAAALTQANGGVDPERRAFLISAGRVCGYALAGALAGGVGGFAERVASALAVARPLRIAVGVLIIAIGLALVVRPLALSSLERAGYAVWRRVLPLVGRLRAPNRAGSSFLLGLAWGWLPCGLVYSALLVAAASRDVFVAALAMACFGLGTLPAVLGASGVGVFSARVGSAAGLAMRRAAGGLLVLFGAWSIAAASGHVPIGGASHVAEGAAACHVDGRAVHADPTSKPR